MWEDKIQVKKGNIGEQIIEEYLGNKGLIVYKPITDKAHGFDRLVSKDKEQIIIIEIKTKARRNYYPDTGINVRNYETYRNLMEKYKLPVFLFFVDEMEGCIYGDFLNILIKKRLVNYKGKEIEYPLIQNDIIYFYQPAMRKIKKLSEEQVNSIKKFSTRNYEYS